jgi:hypothetical protein
LSWDVPESEYHFGLTYFDAEPRKDSWDVPPVVIRGAGLTRPDIWQFGAVAVLGFESGTVAQLERFLASSGEMLPLMGPESQEFWLLNITPAVDCLDRERSLIGPIYYQLVFDQYRLPPSGLFKTPESAQVHIFSVETDSDPTALSFRQTVDEHGLRGIEFEEVWNSRDGSRPFSLIRP